MRNKNSRGNFEPLVSDSGYKPYLDELVDENEKKKLISDIMHEFKDVGLISDYESKEGSRVNTPLSNNKISPKKDISPNYNTNVTSNDKINTSMLSSNQQETVRFNSNLQEFKTFIDMDMTYKKPIKDKKKTKRPPKTDSRSYVKSDEYEDIHINKSNNASNIFD